MRGWACDGPAARNLSERVGADRPFGPTVPDMRKEAAIVMVLAILGWCAAPASASDVLAHWTFDDGAGQQATDAGPLAYHGRLGSTFGAEAADPTWISGHAGGRALSFDGSQYVAVADTPTLEPAHVAVGAWVRRSGSPGRWRYVLSKGSVSCDRAAYGLYSGFRGGMAFYVSSATRYTISPEVPSSLVWDGAWHHIVGSYDGDRVRLWIDGAQVGTGSPAQLSIGYGEGSKGIYLGSYRGSCDRGFTGDIDNVRVWNGPPAQDDSLPIVNPVPGTPTQGPVGPTSATPSSSVRGVKKSPVAPRGCVRVSLSRRTVPLHKRTRVVATVRRGSKRLVGIRVVVRGAGVSAGARTNREGRAGITVKASKRGRLTVRVRGQNTGCPTRTVRAL